METIATLLPYRVTLNEDAGDKFTVAFDCQAEVTDHAEEQAENAYPGCEIVNITQMEPRPLGVVQVSLAAVAICRPDELDQEDGHVQGVYLMEVQEALASAFRASAALDRFHTEVPVKVLENFEFFVFDSESGIVIEPDENEYEYTMTKHGRFIEKISDTVPNFYEVAVLPGSRLWPVNGIKVAAASTEEAQAKALIEACGKRVDPKTVTPTFETSLL